MPHHPSSRAVLGGLLLLGACARPAESTRAPTPDPAPPSATAPSPTVAVDLKAELMARVRATTVPVPPPHVRAKMTSDCARLRYVLRWRGDAIR